uniref:Uncharacterized protein n=1 Tax=Aegilops tauschii subsp. strangulata TaxID=200361 RepID=A0A453GW12_AEGTS
GNSVSENWHVSGVEERPTNMLTWLDDKRRDLTLTQSCCLGSVFATQLKSGQLSIYGFVTRCWRWRMVWLVVTSSHMQIGSETTDDKLSVPLIRLSDRAVQKSEQLPFIIRKKKTLHFVDIE